MGREQLVVSENERDNERRTEGWRRSGNVMDGKCGLGYLGWMSE